jgi:DNA polymerase
MSVDQEKFADPKKWNQIREHLERTYGKNTFVPKKMLARGIYAEGATRKSRVTQEQTTLTTTFDEVVTSPTTESRADDTLESIRTDIGDCRRCKLCEKRTNIVFGEGNPEAKLMFIGEGPGEQEDLQARPFVGKAGQLLDKIIEAMGYKRADVYIANVVKCRPPNNRTPEFDESDVCKQFLFRQLDIIKPKVIVALGGTALKCLIDPEAKISRLRGKFTDYRGVKLMPTFHPAFLLRNPDAKKDVWEDMKKVKAELET